MANGEKVVWYGGEEALQEKSINQMPYAILQCCRLKSLGFINVLDMNNNIQSTTKNAESACIVINGI